MDSSAKNRFAGVRTLCLGVAVCPPLQFRGFHLKLQEEKLSLHIPARKDFTNHGGRISDY